MASSRFPLETTFDPAFGDAAEKLRAFAASKGIKTHYISGVRSQDDQQELWDNYQAGLHGQPLPHPERGPVPLAARPGTSLHERGLAADIEADDPSQEALLRSWGPQFGLRTKGPADPNHFEFAGMPKSGGVPGTFAYGGAPSDTSTAYTEPAKTLTSPALTAIDKSASPAGGLSLNSSPFLTALGTIESNNRNIYSGVDKDYPGQPNSRSQGYYQIDTPTWQQFAAKAGIDTSRFPNAMSAPQDVQAQVASLIPLSRFGGRTQKMLNQQFGGNLDTHATIGQLAGGTTLTSTPDGIVHPPAHPWRRRRRWILEYYADCGRCSQSRARRASSTQLWRFVREGRCRGHAPRRADQAAADKGRTGQYRRGQVAAGEAGGFDSRRGRESAGGNPADAASRAGSGS